MPRRAAGGEKRAAERGGEVARQLAAVAFAVRVEDIQAPTRLGAPIASARQVAMYLVHISLGVSLTRVGALFGRDRSTVAHACRCVEDRRDDAKFDELVDALECTLRRVIAAPVRIAPPATPPSLAA